MLSGSRLTIGIVSPTSTPKTFKLKQHGITHYWTEIKRILFTQKAITTEADNALGERVEMRLCSDPTDRAAELYRALRYNSTPFKRYRIQPSNPPSEKNL